MNDKRRSRPKSSEKYDGNLSLLIQSVDKEIWPKCRALGSIEGLPKNYCFGCHSVGLEENTAKLSEMLEHIMGYITVFKVAKKIDSTGVK